MEFKSGDVPALGLKIINVIRGDDKDSFSHYVYRRSDDLTTFKDKEHLSQIFAGRTGKRVHPDYSGNDKTIVPVEEVATVGNPDAACVYFHIDGEPRSRSMKPAEFEAFLADYKAVDVGKEPEPEKPKKSREQIDAEAKANIAAEAKAAGLCLKCGKPKHPGFCKKADKEAFEVGG